MKRSTSKPEVDLQRRFVVAASVGLLLPRCAWAVASSHAIFCWKLEESGDTARESVADTQDAIASRTGHAAWVGEGANRALRLDGYSVWFRNNASADAFQGNAVTIAAWVALESYPVNEAALLEIDCESTRALRFSLDKWGFLQFGLRTGDSKSLCQSSAPVGRGKWTHLAVSAGPRGTTLFQDGVVCGHLASAMSPLRLTKKVTFVIGGAPDSPLMDHIFPSGVLNGLLRDVRVYNDDCSHETINAIMDESRPNGPPDLQINGQCCANDPQRPVCHAQPPRAWTNEPHGLIHWRGQYHLFYQKNANGPYWGHLNWGHITSPDLLRWTEMPVAISPERGVDSEGCWSGSVIDHGGQLTLIYTGVDGKKACVCIAKSEDGVHFTKYPGNPVIPQQPDGARYKDFRDPYVWREGETYYLLMGSGVMDGGGTVFLYRSNDLLHWELRRQVLSGDPSRSGIFWELPLLLKLGSQHAMIVSEVPGRSSYWVGEWKDEKFKPLSSTPRHLELFNHLLAPTPMVDPDGRIVVMGIIPDERAPQELWSAGWAHLYSLPRILSIDDRGYLVQQPHENVKRLCRPLDAPGQLHLTDSDVTELPNFAEKSFYLKAVIKRGTAATVSLLLRRSPDGQEQTEILYDWTRSRLTLNRSQSSLDTRVKRDTQEIEYATTEQGVLRMEVFVDRSVMEVFVDDRATFAARIYPTRSDSDRVGFKSSGNGAVVEKLQVARLERPL